VDDADGSSNDGKLIDVAAIVIKDKNDRLPPLDDGVDPSI